MNRRRDRDELDEDDDRPLKPKRKSGIPTWLIVILVAAPILMISGCTGMLLMWRTAANRVVDGLKNPNESKRSTALPRDEFRKKAVGKSKKEVLEWLGRPESTSTIFGDELWHFEGVTLDVIAGKVDGRTSLDFGKGDTVVNVMD